MARRRVAATPRPRRREAWTRRGEVFRSAFSRVARAAVGDRDRVPERGALDGLLRRRRRHDAPRQLCDHPTCIPVPGSIKRARLFPLDVDGPWTGRGCHMDILRRRVPPRQLVRKGGAGSRGRWTSRPRGVDAIRRKGTPAARPRLRGLGARRFGRAPSRATSSAAADVFSMRRLRVRSPAVPVEEARGRVGARDFRSAAGTPRGLWWAEGRHSARTGGARRAHQLRERRVGPEPLPGPELTRTEPFLLRFTRLAEREASGTTKAVAHAQSGQRRSALETGRRATSARPTPNENTSETSTRARRGGPSAPPAPQAPRKPPV